MPLSEFLSGGSKKDNRTTMHADYWLPIGIDLGLTGLREHAIG